MIYVFMVCNSKHSNQTWFLSQISINALKTYLKTYLNKKGGKTTLCTGHFKEEKNM